MRVFISGVAGFLGSHLADAFLTDDHVVVGCDSLIGGYLDNVATAVEFHHCDCNDYNSLTKIIRGCDVVYHCAAAAYEGLSIFSPYYVTKNIVQASISMITASIANKARRFILCSSMARYGTQEETPFREDMTPRPQDPYGIGKLSAEMFLRNLAVIHGMEYVIAVPHNIIGPRQKYDDPYRNVASIMINLILQGKPPIIYGDGNQKRCFSFVQDDVELLKKLATEDCVNGEVINIGPDDECITINELAAIIEDIVGVDVKPVYVREKPQEVTCANCSADKARRLLKYEPRVKLRDGLTAVADYIRRRGPRPFKYHIELEIINDRTPETWKKRLF
ncbi:MAG: NAD-dependent epimerase/dehydratase family protein [Planctomycetaceae bacterium]|nr:MAG: NAD-dependent epimerase/dehydratase family protein [Planctomycetaceae bacterium]